MKFKKVLNEVVIDDRADKNAGGWHYYPDGRTKHVKEVVEVHVLSFAQRGNRIVPAYYGKVTKYLPIKNKKPVDQVYVTNKKTDILTQYDTDADKPIQREFESFEECYDFIHDQYIAGNVWPHKLMKNIINDGKTAWGKKFIKHGSRDKGPIFFDTIESESKRLEQVVKWTFKYFNQNSLQEFVTVRKHGDKILKVKYGVDSNLFNAKKVGIELNKIMKSTA